MNISSKPLLQTQSSSSLDLKSQKNRDTTSDFYYKSSFLSCEQILQNFNSNINGLPQDVVPEIQLKKGSNVIKDGDKCPALSLFLSTIINVFNALLTSLAIIMYFSGESSGAIIVLTMVLLASITTFIQEYRSSSAIKNLQKMITSTISVLRLSPIKSFVLALERPNFHTSDTIIKLRVDPDGSIEYYNENILSMGPFNEYQSLIIKISTSELVPGDIVLINAGDMIPADLRLLESNFLQINQSSMTGESMSVEKNVKMDFSQKKQKSFDFISQSSESNYIKTNKKKILKKDQKNIFDYSNLVFQGTSVVNGSAKALVIATGNNTMFGQMKNKLNEPKKKSAFDQGINKYFLMMVGFMIALGTFTLLVNVGLKETSWSDSVEFSLAVAVGLIPEMLPMIITVNLAKGAIEMAKKDVVVKKLTAIQNIGAMDILCIDKTGTLTDGKIILNTSFNAKGEQTPYALELAYYISKLQTGYKNFLDDAIIEKVEDDKIFINADIEKFEKEQFNEIYIKPKLSDVIKYSEIPFDFDRRCMSVVISHSASKNNKIILCKGAPEEILLKSSYYVDSRFSTIYQNNQMCISDQTESLTPIKAKEILKIITENNQRGFRAIAVAYKVLEANNTNNELYKLSDEKDLTFVGFLTFYDPPKSTASEFIKKITGYGLKIMVLTGDSPQIAQYICEKVGIPVESLITGSDIANCEEIDIEAKIESGSLFSKLTPSQKEYIITVLQKKGHVVGFMGDGINDILALKAADCSISVENALDITKQCANIILLKKNLDVLASGVEEGRKTFGNIVKYLKMSASSNFGSVFSLTGASLLFNFLPITAVQMLIQTLLYDLSQCGIPFDNVDIEFLEKPRKWEILDIAKFMICIGPISSIFDYCTFGLMWYFFGNHGETSVEVTQFQTAWFIEGLMTQTLIVHIIRTHKIPFVESRASWVMIGTTGTVMCLCLVIPYSFLADYVPYVPPEGVFYVFLVGFLLGYAVLAHVGTRFYYKYNELK